MSEFLFKLLTTSIPGTKSRKVDKFFMTHDIAWFNKFSIYQNLDSPLNRMLRALSMLRRRISRRGLLLLSAALLFLAVASFYIISFSRFKPVTTTEPLSLPEEFLSPFHTRVSIYLYWWFISETLSSTLRKSLQQLHEDTYKHPVFLSFSRNYLIRVIWLKKQQEPKSRLFYCSHGQIFHVIKNWIVG